MADKSVECVFLQKEPDRFQELISLSQRNISNSKKYLVEIARWDAKVISQHIGRSQFTKPQPTFRKTKDIEVLPARRTARRVDW